MSEDDKIYLNRMKIFTNQNVYEAALDRMRWLFDEFENIYINFSGGKDSTVTLNLALIVAEEKGRLPLKVSFIDQEAEWQTVIDYIRTVFSDPRIEPLWYQIPIKIFNATSVTEPWLMCWEPGREWMRPKEPNSIHENVFGTDRFAHMFDKLQEYYHPNAPAVNVAGVRCSESPARLKGLTSYETYKGETWGRATNKKRGHYTMYPLYDWCDADIWKAIHSNGWEYCKIYDFQYQYGVPLREMRVSNLHHETAVKTLFYLQEIEGDTWNKLAKRLAGVNTAGHMRGDMMCPKELPFMFATWTEYRDYILENLITDDKMKAAFEKQFRMMDKMYADPKIIADLCKAQISAVLVNDYHGTKMSSFVASHGQYAVRAGSKGGIISKREKAERAAKEKAKDAAA